ncbi:MAG: CYTH domain-containing protein, partial [Sutterellaceae bacterium]|nr:CYTH domain-containing protein [Sutterellaceae bacterium]
MTQQKNKGLEIERKFLVTGNAWKALGTPTVFRQGYLNDEKERTVRVRVAGDKGFLTIKGKNTGAVRAEFEYEIPVEDAVKMLETMALRPLIEKTRTVIVYGGHTWEVDEFMGDNAGLVVAEIELTDENEVFDKPDWIGEEVTGDARYYNSSLV